VVLILGMAGTRAERQSEDHSFEGPIRGNGSEKSIDLGDPERTSEKSKTADDIPPDGGYGWVCTGCCFLINAHTWGVNSVRSTETYISLKLAKLHSLMAYSSHTTYRTTPFPVQRLSNMHS